MTETEQTEGEQTEGEPTGTETEQPTEGEQTTGTEAQRARREAQGLRTRLRETEAERDALSGRLTAMQKQRAEQLVADRLFIAADLWLMTELPDLLGDDGEIDTAKVDAVVATIAAERPIWLRPPAGEVGTRPSVGLTPANGTPSAAPPAPSWGSVLRPAASSTTREAPEPIIGSGARRRD